MRFVIRLAACAALVTAAPVAFAHHASISGTGGDGGITTIGAGTLEEGQFAAAFFVEYIRFRQLSDATLLANAGNDVHGLGSIESRTAAVAYGITNDLMVMARFPWIRRTGIREADPPDVVDRGPTEGFGDITVLGQYRFLNNQSSGTQAAALFGVKLPTGTTGLIDRFGERFEPEFQPGSGSWDALLGATVSQRLAPRWSVHASVLAVFAGTGSADTNLGNRFVYNAAAVYRVFGETANEPHTHGHDAFAHAGHSHSRMPRKAAAAPAVAHSHVALDAILELNGEWHDRERIAGVTNVNSGGNTVYLSPGLRLTVENWAGFATFGVPVVNETNGVQAKADWRAMVGIAVSTGR